MVLTKIILHHLICMISASELIASERTLADMRLDVALSLAKHFRIAFCVIGKSNEPNGLNYIISQSYPSRMNLLTNILTFQEISKFMSENLNLKHGGRTMIILNMENDTLAYLKQLSYNTSLSSAIWLLYSESYFHSKSFQDIYIPFDCEFIFISQSEFTFFLTEIYRIGKKTRIETYDLGYWTEEKGLVIAGIHLYSRRKNLKGHRLKAIIKNNPPYVSIERNAEGKPEFKGYLYEIWNELEFRLNFRTEFPENYFEEDPKEILENEEIDFAVARIPIEISAFDKMDFSQPIHEAKSFMFGHRPGSELDWDSYLKPFSPNTWFVTVFWLFSSSLALAILYRKAWYFSTSEREADYFIFTFSESLLTVFRALCMQGSDVTPRSYSCRVFFLSIYLTALVVTSAFSAALFSLLTIPRPRSSFNSLEEVLSNNKFQIGYPSDPEFHKFIEVSHLSGIPLEHYNIDITTEQFSHFVFTFVFCLFWQVIAAKNVCQDFSNKLVSINRKELSEKLLKSKSDAQRTPQQGVERICKDKFYVFMFDLPNVLYLMQNASRSCQDNILPFGSPLFTELIGFGFKKRNPFREIINFHLIRMKNEGILKRLLLNYWPPQIPTVQAAWVRVTLSDISPILYMFALGAVLGMIFLQAERISFYLKRKKKTISPTPAVDKERLFIDPKMLLASFPTIRSPKQDFYI